MRVVASAPGKLVLTGEYAVLDGAPAVVTAIDRRACVVLEDGVDAYRIDAPDVGIAAARGHLGSDRRTRWLDLDAAAASRLVLIAAVIDALGADKPPAPFHATLDTGAFFDETAARTKLGLGSSAALTVAFGAALRARENRGPLSLERLIEVHRRLQDGRGSGLDIATCLNGGTITYRLRDGRPQVTQGAWPDGLEFCCVWSGRSASTGALLRRMSVWRDAAPQRSAVLMHELAERADAAAAAFEEGTAAALVEAVAGYAQGLARLGMASGIDIVCAEHRTIAAVAADCGIAYKPSGAGGGDIGVALATDADRLEGFRRRVACAGFTALELKPGARGLLLQIEAIRRTSP